MNYGEFLNLFKKTPAAYVPGVYEFSDVVEMLQSSGVVGRVVGETAHYVEGLF